MKHLLLLLAFTFISGVCLSQSPEAINFQSIVRDGGGTPVTNQTVSIRINIIPNLSTNPADYQETFTATTNTFGLVNFQIGTGTPTIGTFNTITWEANTYFIKIEVDPDGGSSYSEIGTQQLVSVPYALHATTAESAPGDNLGDHIATTNIQTGGHWLSGDGDAEGIFVSPDGNVGIGSSTGTSTLHVSGGAGDAVISIVADTNNLGENDNPTINFEQDGGAITAFIGLEGTAGTQANNTISNALLLSHTGGDVQIATNDEARMTVQSDGKVGIGIASPSHELHVVGSIKMEDGNQAANSVMLGDINGVATWGPLASLQDNLGNHIATENIQTAGHWISNDGDNEGLYLTNNGQMGLNISTPYSWGNTNFQINSMSTGGVWTSYTNADTDTTSGNGFQVGITSNENATLYNHENTDMVFFNNNLEHMRLLANGDLGIGTSTPFAKVHSHNNDPSGSFMLFTNGNTTSNDSSGFRIGINNSARARLQNFENTDMIFYNNKIEYMRLKANGELGIGTGSPAGKLDIVGGDVIIRSTTAAAGSRLRIDTDGHGFFPGNEYVVIQALDHSGANNRDVMFLNNANSPILHLRQDRHVGIGRICATNALEVNGEISSNSGNLLSHSDERLKKNITQLPSSEALDKISKLNGITYLWNDTVTGYTRPEEIQYGFTAQNIQAVFPDLVKEDKLGYLQTSYGTMDAMLVESIKALNERLILLEEANRTLIEEVNLLRNTSK